jgi:chemotaxis protein MotB
VKIRDKFPTNWELSTARATTVVRFFIERGGVNRESLEAVGFADTRPVASNDTEEGRTENRRIEIVLYPRDLSQVVGEVKP